MRRTRRRRRVVGGPPPPRWLRARQGQRAPKPRVAPLARRLPRPPPSPTSSASPGQTSPRGPIRSIEGVGRVPSRRFRHRRRRWSKLPTTTCGSDGAADPAGHRRYDLDVVEDVGAVCVTATTTGGDATRGFGRPRGRPGGDLRRGRQAVRGEARGGRPSRPGPPHRRLGRRAEDATGRRNGARRGTARGVAGVSSSSTRGHPTAPSSAPPGRSIGRVERVGSGAEGGARVAGQPSSRSVRGRLSGEEAVYVPAVRRRRRDLTTRGLFATRQTRSASPRSRGVARTRRGARRPPRERTRAAPPPGLELSAGRSRRVARGGAQRRRAHRRRRRSDLFREMTALAALFRVHGGVVGLWVGSGCRGGGFVGRGGEGDVRGGMRLWWRSARGSA